MIEQFYLIHKWDSNRVDLRVMVILHYSNFKTREPHHKMQFNVIGRKKQLRIIKK